jgi:Trk K+ transport system NAD-binding subunit
MIIEKIQMVPIGTYLKLKTTNTEILRLKAHKRSSVTGKSLRELDSFSKKSIVVGAIIRKDEVIIPWGGVVIREGDEVIMVCRKEYNKWLTKLFNP